MSAEAAELAALALSPIVDHEFGHDIGQREFNRAHRAIGDDEGALLDPFSLEHRRRFVETGCLNNDVGTFEAGLPIRGCDDLLSEITGEPFGKAIAAFLPSRMDPDLVEIEEMIEQPHVPIGGAACSDMA